MMKQPIEAAIRAAFPETAVQTEAILQAEYANSEDAQELRTVLANRTWPEITRRDLFRHREMLIALTGQAFQAYVAAYLVAALDDDDYGADLRQYLVHSLAAISDDDVHIRTAAERVSRLGPAQRTVIAETLAFLVEQYRDKGAKSLLVAWSERSPGAS